MIAWINFIARSALYVRGIVKIGCSVCSFVRPSVRSSGFFWFFIEKNIGVTRCRLAVRFWNPGFKTFLQKVVEVLLSKQNEKYCDRFLDHFFELFWKKVETSHFSSQPLRARAVRGVSSIRSRREFYLEIYFSHQEHFATRSQKFPDGTNLIRNQLQFQMKHKPIWKASGWNKSNQSVRDRFPIENKTIRKDRNVGTSRLAIIGWSQKKYESHVVASRLIFWSIFQRSPLLIPPPRREIAPQIDSRSKSKRIDLRDGKRYRFLVFFPAKVRIGS